MLKLMNMQRITYQMLVDSVMPQPRSMMSLMPCTVSVCGSSLTYINSINTTRSICFLSRNRLMNDDNN